MSAFPGAAWEDQLLGASETRAWPMRSVRCHWTEKKRSVVVGRPKLGSCMGGDRDSFNGHVFLPCSKRGPWQTTPQVWRVWQCSAVQQRQMQILQACSRPRSAGGEPKSWCAGAFLAAAVVIFGGLSKLCHTQHARHTCARSRGGRRNQCLQTAASYVRRFSRPSSSSTWGCLTALDDVGVCHGVRLQSQAS